MKKFRKLLALGLAAVMTATAFAGCGNSGGGSANKDYDFYIFNTKGENADAMQAAVNAYQEKTGLKVKLFSLGSGTNSADTLRAEMNSKNKPALFSIMNIQELAEWKEGGFAADLSTLTTNANFKTLHDALPDNLKLTTNGTDSYGIPYNVEGYGYIVDTLMLADLFGADNVDAFLNDCKLATYDEFAAMVDTLDAYIQNGTAGTVTVNGKGYPLAAEKTGLTQNLTGVFSVAGSEKWTYGDHMINIAIDTVFENPSATKNATAEQIDELKKPFIAYAKALDVKTSHVAGENGPLPRSPEMINSTTNGYDPAVQKFADHKAIFMKQGNWVYTNIEKVNPEIVKTLTFVPVKMPFTDNDIKVPGLTAEKMQRSIPVFVPNYYAINSKVSEEEQNMAMDFLVWLNTTDEGKKFITENMAFIPYNADPATTNLGNSLGDSIIQYMASGDTITNAYAGAPTNWSGETVGLEIMEKYLTKAEWTEDDYNAIADYAIAKWKEMAGLQ